MLKPLQWAEGTQRLAEPVSKTTVKGCGGLPSPISPKYCAFMKSLRATFVPPSPPLLLAARAVAADAPDRHAATQVSVWLRPALPLLASAAPSPPSSAS